MLRQVPLRLAALTPSRAVSATVHRPFLLNTTRLLTTGSATSTETRSPPPLHARGGQFETTTSQTPTKSAPRVLTYSVGRTASNNISVYHDKRSGGTRKVTTIRKIEGSSQDLKKDIVEEMKFPKDDVKVNPITGHVKIKGWHLDRVKSWLEARGF